jgi:hypothetical protein
MGGGGKGSVGHALAPSESRPYICDVQKSARTHHLPRARTDLTFRTHGGEFALHDRSGTTAQVMNLTAALVWTYCDGRNDPSAIAAAVARDLPDAGDPSSMEARVDLLLTEFASNGILA